MGPFHSRSGKALRSWASHSSSKDPDLGIDGGKNETKLDEGVPQFMGQDLAALKTLLGEFLLRAGKGLPQMEREKFRAEASGKLLDDPGGTVFTAQGVRQEMNLDDGRNDIFRILPDGPAPPVHRIFQGPQTIAIEIGLPHQNGFHVVDVFQFPPQLLANTSLIFRRVICRPALLLFHAPSHRLQRVVGAIPIFLPALSRIVIIGNRRQPPVDVVSCPPCESRR